MNFSERPVVGTAGGTQATLDAWDVENNRTHPFLILNCHDSVLSHLRAVDTAPKVWTVLTTLYEMKTPGRIITLETQLLQLRVEDFPSVSAFAAKMKEMREELAVCGKTISSEDIVTACSFACWCIGPPIHGVDVAIQGIAKRHSMVAFTSLSRFNILGLSLKLGRAARLGAPLLKNNNNKKKSIRLLVVA